MAPTPLPNNGPSVVAPVRVANAALANDIKASQNVYLGKNTTVTEDSTTGLQTFLPVTTKNVLTAQEGLNINSNGTTSKLTIDKDGNVSGSGTIAAVGSISTANSLFVTPNGSTESVFSVSDQGSTYMKSDLSVNSHFYVASGDGSVVADGNANVGKILTVGGESKLAGTVDVNNGKVVLDNSGKITTVADAEIGTKLVVKGDLNVHDKQLFVDSVLNEVDISSKLKVAGDVSVGLDKVKMNSSNGDVDMAGKLAVAGDVKVGLDKVKMDSLTGAIDMAGSLNIASKNIWLSSDGSMSAKGDLNINDMFFVDNFDGHAKTEFHLYERSNAFSEKLVHFNNEETKLIDACGNEVVVGSAEYAQLFDTTTSKYLTTQKYVDEVVFQQTARINSILGADSSVLDSFNNVYSIVKAIEGSTTAAETLTTVAGQYSVINTSVSTLAGNAVNSVAVNASPAVWADACAPLPIPTKLYDANGVATANTYSLDGWYFKNMLLGSKINWYIPAPADLTVEHMDNLYMNLTFFQNCTIGNAPWLSVFTKAKGTGDYWDGLANAQIQYLYSSPSNAAFVAGTNYTIHTSAAAPLNINGNTAVKPAIVKTFNGASPENRAGKSGTSYDTSMISGSDKVVAFCISSSSSAEAKKLEFVLNSVCIQQNSLTGPKGTSKFLLNNASVATNYMFNNLFKKNSDFSPIDQPYNVVQGLFPNKKQIDAYEALYTAV